MTDRDRTARATTEADRERLPRELVRRIIQTFAEDAIRSGVVDPRGKSDDELRVELLQTLQQLCIDENFGFILDHTRGLLKRARQFEKQGDCYCACLFYATWSEHWVNGVIATLCKRNHIATEESSQMIRDVALRGKTSWLFSLLGLPALATRHRNAILHLMDLRNGFVHYKWIGRNEGVMDQEEEHIRKAVTGFAATVKYLSRYESRNVYFDSRAKTRRVLDESPEETTDA